jgi:hypothetical protein
MVTEVFNRDEGMFKWFGERWYWCVAGGRPGSASMAVWVDYIILPYGNVTDKGFIAFPLWMYGASKARYLPVEPESKIA